MTTIIGCWKNSLNKGKFFNTPTSGIQILRDAQDDKEKTGLRRSNQNASVFEVQRLGVLIKTFKRFIFYNDICKTFFVIQSEAKNLGYIHVVVFVYVTEIFRYAQQHVFLPSVV